MEGVSTHRWTSHSEIGKRSLLKEDRARDFFHLTKITERLAWLHIVARKESRWTHVSSSSEESNNRSLIVSNRPIALIVQQRGPHRVELQDASSRISQHSLLEERVKVECWPRTGLHEKRETEHLLEDQRDFVSSVIPTMSARITTRRTLAPA
jgi:hypothetical protein